MTNRVDKLTTIDSLDRVYTDVNRLVMGHDFKHNRKRADDLFYYRINSIVLRTFGAYMAFTCLDRFLSGKAIVPKILVSIIAYYACISLKKNYKKN
jgi:hypothetical protein